MRDKHGSMASNQTSVLHETWDFLKERKVWWIIPIVAMLLLVAVLIILSQSSAISPLVYAFA